MKAAAKLKELYLRIACSFRTGRSVRTLARRHGLKVSTVEAVIRHFVRT